MSGVWVFKNGVYRLVENPAAEHGAASRKKCLVYLPTGQVVTSYRCLEQILTGLGWERYYSGDPDLFQFHKQSSIDLISLPRDYNKFNSIYMYDIVVKNPNLFQCVNNVVFAAVHDQYAWLCLCRLR
nr:flowering-promoting factor 1 [Ipomoea trifida]GMD14948.1 flowering-promoting factor 1 [Ipomoea batatas]